MLRYLRRLGMNFVRVIVVSLGLIGPGVAQQGLSGAVIPGADDAAFREALDLWLVNDEAGALPRFADLARANSTAAQILLAVIDKTAALQGPWLSEQSRATRIALLRKEGGMSGQSWIHDAAKDSALAQLWIDLWQMNATPETAKAFADAGEARASRETLLAIAARQEGGFDAELLTASWFPIELWYLGTDALLTRSARDTLHPGDPQWRFAGEELSTPARRDWLDASMLAIGLREICTQQCGSDTTGCADALYTGLSSYGALVAFGTPVASLISTADFSASERGKSALARRIMLGSSARGRSYQLGAIGALDQCAADWLKTQYQSYMPRSRSNGVIR